MYVQRPTNASIVIRLDEWKQFKGYDIGLQIEKYSPAMKVGPELPFKLHGHCIMSVNDTFIYLIGGFNQFRKYQSNIWSFDALLNKWESLGDNSSLPCEPWKVGFQSTCAYFVSTVKS